MRRAATVVIALLDGVVWAAIVYATAFQQSDPATSGFDRAGWQVVSALFVLTAVPALILAALNRAPGIALTLALLFPAIFAGLFAFVVMLFA